MNRKKLVRLLLLIVVGLIAILFARSYTHDLSDAVSNDDTEDILKLDMTFLTETKTVVEGEIIERSVLPDPGELDYPDCRYTIHFKGNAILSGNPCPKEISLVVDGIKNCKTTRLDELKPGDKVECLIIPFESLPSEAQSTQTVDNLNLFMFSSYYAVTLRKIRHFHRVKYMSESQIFFSDGNEDYVSIFEQHVNPAVSPELKQAQENTMRQDRQRMELLLSEYDDEKIDIINKRFEESWKKEKSKDPPGYNRIVNKDGRFVWRNINSSFWCLPEDYTFLSKPDMLTSETLDCFSALKDACEANGVQLMITLVPDLYVIAARVMNPEFRDIPDLQSAMFVKQLSEIGVETIYSSDVILQNYNKYPLAFWYPSDPHPGDVTQEAIAEKVSDRIKRYQLKQDLDSSLFSIEPALTGMVFPDNCDIGGNQPGSFFPGNKILYGKKTISRDGDAPVLIIGNSFIQTPVSASVSFPSYYSLKTLSSVDWYVSYQYGSITDIPLRFLSDAPFFFGGKKVLIMHLVTSQLCFVNQSSMMQNLRMCDSDLLILNKKQCRGHYRLPRMDEIQLSEAKRIMPDFEDDNLFLIDERGIIKHSFDLRLSGENGIDDTKPIICIFPSLSAEGMSIDISVNDQKKHMYSNTLSQHSKFFIMVFELPAGTRSITLKFEGKPGSVFAVKDLQIWQ